ncbi:integrase [Bradyrhizobium jicamae]|uniref:integrase n=1 Tax=Bradyrhizobium jicamae TaxID=280332 RepID=UPI0028A10F91|nr:integrase [Bradyrhizobium jicamae]
MPYWFADAAAVRAGFTIKSRNLSHLVSTPAQVVEQAQILQREMLAFMAGDQRGAVKFDRTFKSLLEIYQTDTESPYRTTIKKHTAQSYAVYLKKMIVHIGNRRIDECDGRDVRRWFRQWQTSGLGAARMSLAVLKAAVSFGIVCRLQGCAEFKTILGVLEFERLPSRKFAPTAAQIIAARKAAHAAGAPERALAYAIQFETTLRQWDVIGQWVGLDDPRPSAVIGYGMKWIGPSWAAIDSNLILAKVKPTKTEDTSEVEVSFDLSACPMVCEELAHIPPAERKGPLIVNRDTGLPYIRHTFQNGWKADFKAAGLPAGMWNRDLRAGGITEGGMAGASKDDRRKLAGHAKEETTEIYDRDQVEAHRRVMQKRKQYRAENGQ